MEMKLILCACVVFGLSMSSVSVIFCRRSVVSPLPCDSLLCACPPVLCVCVRARARVCAHVLVVRACLVSVVYRRIHSAAQHFCARIRVCLCLSVGVCASFAFEMTTHSGAAAVEGAWVAEVEVEGAAAAEGEGEGVVVVVDLRKQVRITPNWLDFVV